jgi:hypothetical protein
LAELEADEDHRPQPVRISSVANLKRAGILESGAAERHLDGANQASRVGKSWALASAEVVCSSFHLLT